MPSKDVKAPLERLAGNYRWVWDQPVQQIFETADPETWKQTRNPHDVMRSLAAKQLKQLAGNAAFQKRIQEADGDLAKYLADKPAQPLVGYFCMEHGVAPDLRVYAGGLGMLAGCIEKTASDRGIAMVAVGLRYRQRFSQRLSYGWQSEEWVDTDPVAAGLELCKDVTVHINLAGEQVAIRVWRAKVGRVDLYLLDTDVEENPDHLRHITDRLYMGEKEHRLRQEMVLGVGGVRALAALGLTPKVFHANEGHAGFMCLERLESLVTEGVPIDPAIELVRRGTIFTTHTAVAAGFDLFDRGLIEKYFSGWAHRCGVSMEWLMNLGHFPYQSGHEPFNMAVLCTRLADYVNAVSRIHREITERDVLGALWPGRAAPVRCVTNGVHPRTWTPARMAALFERYVGPEWDYADAEAWQGVWEIPDADLWQARQALRQDMVDFVRWYLPRTLRAQGWADDLEWAEQVLDPEACTIVVARRAAEYKETDLLVSDLGRLKAMTSHGPRPVNVIFSGLAHPSDQGGKERIRRIVECSYTPDLRHNVVYLPDYSMRVAQALLAGADIWLNHPRRGDEACGTSFMKSVFAGGQILTTADGGADELIVDGYNGWIICDRSGPASREAMASSAFGALEHVILPRYNDRFDDEIPTAWTDGVKQSLASLAWQVSAGAMMTNYNHLYVDAARRARMLAQRVADRVPALAGH
ncbi:MAG: alpha-glucan family phosphorylase [Micromonosporaceae bacterium]|nr:alpha-glucan family phosphorylase [Micromonosporaceae bacterium]